MKSINKKVLILLMPILVMSFVGLASAFSINNNGTDITNSLVSGTGAAGLEVIQLNYDPFPVTPGSYFDLWIQARWVGQGSPQNATFMLQPDYPFSLNSNESATMSFGALSSTPVLLHYKVRVSQDAVEGDNQIKLAYNADGSNRYWSISTMNIQVAQAQTDFDLVIQDQSSTTTSIAIANTGKNTANSMIVRIPDQNDFRVSGTNGQMVGNLNAGDYTIVSFTLNPVGRSSNRTLDVEIDYTDSIAVRRSVIKEISFGSMGAIGLNSTFIRGARTGTTTTSSQSSSMFGSWQFWAALIVIIAAVIYFYKNKNNKTGKTENNKNGTPDWVTSERKKRG